MIRKEDIEKIKNDWAAEGVREEITRKVSKIKQFSDEIGCSSFNKDFKWGKLELIATALRDIVILRKEWEKIKGGNEDGGQS